MFHPAIQTWFDTTFSAPTEVQQQAWQSILAGKHTLLAAPTGSGKTLAAFLASIDRLLKEGLQRCSSEEEGESGKLDDQVRVLYISPLKALSNDIQINLQAPLLGMREQLEAQGFPDVDIRAWVRTGDTPQSERRKAIKTPPHILVTTPESVYILLTSESGRNMLSTVDTVIVDEIHALAGNKRGSHLSLSLERLEALVQRSNESINPQIPAKPLQRIGLSATQKPIQDMACFLLGQRTGQSCEIIDTGHVRDRDLALVLPQSPLEAVMANEVWTEIYNALELLIQSHKTTLIFVNTRRLAERVTRHLGERLEHLDSEDSHTVMAHHGSMSKERRLKAEQRLKGGKLQCLVATASLELGIDIGDIDLVCQLGSPRSIAAFLQRVGRSGHAVGATPKGRLFPLSRDELVETTALLHAARQGDLDRVIIPHQPLDVLAQQIVAEVSGHDWNVDALFRIFQSAWPYRNLSLADFDTMIQMLADGYSTQRGRRGAYLHLDAVNRKVRARRNARLVAITNGGAIPDQFDCEVILQPEGFRIGTVGEDFAFESMPGDIFQLGNVSYRILKSETGKVFVEDAKGQPPNIPFWLGDAPGRTNELSKAVSDLRAAVDERLEKTGYKGASEARDKLRDKASGKESGVGGLQPTCQWLQKQYGLQSTAAEQLVNYLAATKLALGRIPTQKHIVFERFFDEVGDMHFVVHSPFGSRLNRAWGLSLRKRFCRKFNFELQAAALEDTIVLSLSSSHSFPLMEVAHYLNANTVRDVLIQAVLDVPMFPTRWRWNATISLAVQRFRGGKRNPPYFQRSDAEDLVAVLFPDQIACGENIAGDREVPDHPLVQQTLHDCLYETMDIEGLETVLRAIESKQIKITACDLTSPSPLAAEVLTAKPYAFLDDAPAEERRTMAVQTRGFLDPVEANDLAKLDPEAIDKVRREAWPQVRDKDELHDALMILGFVTQGEADRGNLNDALSISWQGIFQQLVDDQRATALLISDEIRLWVAAERLHEFLVLFPDIKMKPEIQPFPRVSCDVGMDAGIDEDTNTDKQKTLVEIIRSRLEGLGPVSALELGMPLSTAIEVKEIELALLALEQEGFVIRGQFTDKAIKNHSTEWCERRLLARIHRYTINRLRSEIEPVSLSDYMCFLFHWHGLDEKGEGLESLSAVLEQLEGFPVAAAAWEKDILPARIRLYSANMLETLSLTGRISWLRLSVPYRASDRTLSAPNTTNTSKTRDKKSVKQKRSPVSQSPITIVQRSNLEIWRSFFPVLNPEEIPLSAYAKKLAHLLSQQGAMFFMDLVQHSGMLRTQVEDALGELVNWGLVTADSFAGLRALVTPAAKRSKYAGRRGRPGGSLSLFDHAGRWSLIDQKSIEQEVDCNTDTRSKSTQSDSLHLDYVANLLLKRYGVVFRKVLDREVGLPPWRDLLRVYWRMEARGEIRGGRFVQSVSGEQFALAGAVGSLRKIRNSKSDESSRKKRDSEGKSIEENSYIVISAADPLNLQGVLLPDVKIPVSGTQRVAYRDGKVVAVLDKQGVHYLEVLEDGEKTIIRGKMFRS